MIIVAWIIVGLFAALVLVLVVRKSLEEWHPFGPTAGVFVFLCLVLLAAAYICNYYDRRISPPTTDAIAQSTNWMGYPITVYGTNDETLQLGLAPNGMVVWRRVDTNIWYKAKQL